jgi:hypothetical protein
MQTKKVRAASKKPRLVYTPNEVKAISLKEFANGYERGAKMKRWLLVSKVVVNVASAIGIIAAFVIAYNLEMA